MKFPIFGASDDAPNTGSTRFNYIGNSFITDWNGTEASRQVPISEDITITNLKVMVDTSPGSGKSRSFTIRKNGADTGVTCTISDANTSAIFSGSVSFAAGDLICLASTPSGTPTAPGNIYWWMHMNTSGQKCFILGSADATFSNSANSFTQPFGSSTTTANATNQSAIVPTGGNITKSYVFSGTGSPGSGKSYAISLRINNTTDALTATVSDANTSASATGSQALSASDVITVKSVPSGTPTASRYAWCFTFEPTNNGESFYGLGNGTNIPTAATGYEQLIGVGTQTWGATESALFLKLPECTIKNLYVSISAAAGVGASRIFTLRDNGADSTLTVTVSGSSATTGSDTTHSVTHTADQTIDISAAISSTPATATGRFGYVILTAQPTVGIHQMML